MPKSGTIALKMKKLVSSITLAHSQNAACIIQKTINYTDNLKPYIKASDMCKIMNAFGKLLQTEVYFSMLQLLYFYQ
jgi:spore coat polysaccharide biosynthesis predicted glycosyltransferase SpsG